MIVKHDLILFVQVWFEFCLRRPSVGESNTSFKTEKAIVFVLFLKAKLVPLLNIEFVFTNQI